MQRLRYIDQLWWHARELHRRLAECQHQQCTLAVRLWPVNGSHRSRLAWSSPVCGGSRLPNWFEHDCAHWLATSHFRHDVLLHRGAQGKVSILSSVLCFFSSVHFLQSALVVYSICPCCSVLGKPCRFSLCGDGIGSLHGLDHSTNVVFHPSRDDWSNYNANVARSLLQVTSLVLTMTKADAQCQCTGALAVIYSSASESF